MSFYRLLWVACLYETKKLFTDSDENYVEFRLCDQVANLSPHKVQLWYIVGLSYATLVSTV
jgi:hypothetical protein